MLIHLSQSRSKLIVSAFIILLLKATGCQQKEEEFCIEPADFQLKGLAKEITLSTERTIIATKDYFINPQLIDSATSANYTKLELATNKDSIYIIALENTPLLSELKVWISGIAYSILLVREIKVKQLVSFAANSLIYKSVKLAGDMNNWNPDKAIMELHDGIWEIELMLDTGVYNYQLVVDDKWITDPANPETVPNTKGGSSSVLTVTREVEEPAPTISISDDLNAEFTVRCESELDEIFVFWQNFRLHECCVQKGGTDYIITIPHTADFHKNSTMRIRAYNSFGISNEISIPLDLRSILHE